MKSPSSSKKSGHTRLIVTDGRASLPKTGKTGAATSSLVKVRFGSVTVETLTPAKTEVQRNVKSGQSALKRVSSKMHKPGVVLAQIKNVPVYHADPNVPGQIVRELNGVAQPGTFINGKFKPASK
jgi:hypothetical protein